MLVGDKRAIRWVSCEGRLEVEKLPGRPVEGGREANGKPLFIAQAYWNRAVVPGKFSVEETAKEEQMSRAV